jgi:hypothetical protein
MRCVRLHTWPNRLYAAANAGSKPPHSRDFDLAADRNDGLNR